MPQALPLLKKVIGHCLVPCWSAVQYIWRHLFSYEFIKYLNRLPNSLFYFCMQSHHWWRQMSPSTGSHTGQSHYTLSTMVHGWGGMLWIISFFSPHTFLLHVLWFMLIFVSFVRHTLFQKSWDSFRCFLEKRNLTFLFGRLWHIYTCIKGRVFDLLGLCQGVLFVIESILLPSTIVVFWHNCSIWHNWVHPLLFLVDNEPVDLGMIIHAPTTISKGSCKD